MPESTLSLSYNDYIAEVGYFAGWGRGAVFGQTPYTADQQTTLDRCVSGGIRRFYFPPPLQPGASAHVWSFLKPVLTLDLAPGANTIALPDDFGGLEGDITCKATSQALVPWVVRIFNEQKVRELYSQSTSATGPPQRAAIQPIKGTTQLTSSRDQLFIYPNADQDYQLQVQYYILPDYLSGSNPYVYGGAAHVDTIMESCLAMFEQKMNDTAAIHSALFMERLAASISYDGKSKPEFQGYNGDRSDRRDFRDSRLLSFPPSTYNGGSF